MTIMRGEINLKKCLACGDNIAKGLFCSKHATVVADALRMVGASKVIDRAKLKADAEARHAAQKAKKDAP